MNPDEHGAGCDFGAACSAACTSANVGEQAVAIVAILPGDAVELDDGSARYLDDEYDRDPLIEFVSPGVRPSARRSLLLPQLHTIQKGHGDVANQ